jgi:RNA polymerase sigma-70 factor (ECF subfamily)
MFWVVARLVCWIQKDNKMPSTNPLDLKAIFAEEAHNVWRLVVRILGNDGDDAADCFQQAFVELATKHERATDIRAPVALLKRIAATRAIDLVRRRIRERERTEIIGEANLTARGSHEPESQARTNELLVDLRDALTKIPRQQSVAFVLIEVEHASRPDAAIAMGVTINHLGVLLNRGRTNLRKHLAAHEPTRKE